ncbi:MAG TPA: carboxypeptidase-like regulatory domain-containing protein [Gemmatimonadaceae bacterium]
MAVNRRLFVRSAVLAAAAVTFGAGCTDFSHTPESLGHLIVSAKDESGAAVPGIKFTAIKAADNTPWAAVVTGSSGTAEFRESDGGILPQLYRVRFDETTPGYQLADGQQIEQNVQVVLGQTHNVSFTVKKSTPGGPSGGG